MQSIMKFDQSTAFPKYAYFTNPFWQRQQAIL